MKRVFVALLAFGTFGVEAQYSGRSGVRYISDGSIFAVRRTDDWSPNRRDGRCSIRVRIDDDSDVELRGDLIRIRVLKGGLGRDEGSECNAPLPTSGNIRNFRFRGIDGRGNPRLVQEPGSRNYYVAVVNVQDPQGGDERYRFDLSWEWDGQGGGGLFPDRPTTRPTPPPGGGIFPDQPTTLPAPVDPGSNSLQDMNTSIAGRGTLKDGTRQNNLTDLNVRIRGDRCQITLTNDRQQRFEMSGNVLPNTTRCIINSSNRGSTSANALILLDGNRLRGVDVGGNVNGRNFQGNFRMSPGQPTTRPTPVVPGSNYLQDMNTSTLGSGTLSDGTRNTI